MMKIYENDGKNYRNLLCSSRDTKRRMHIVPPQVSAVQQVAAVKYIQIIYIQPPGDRVIINILCTIAVVLARQVTAGHLSRVFDNRILI